jgi:type VII secretion-associated protein (TIGR03931 family)
VTTAIVEVGPATVRGPNEIEQDLVSVALECIDDDLVLLGDRPVSVSDVWRDLMCAAVGHQADTVVLICPAWWRNGRIERVRAAALAAAPEVVVTERTTVLRDHLTDVPTTILEIDAEFVVVSHPGARRVIVARRGDETEAVVSAIGASASVLVDAPEGVDGAQRLGTMIVHRLRAKGIAAGFADEDSVRGAALGPQQNESVEEVVDAPPPVSRGRRRAAVMVGVVAAVVLCAGYVIRGSTSDVQPGQMPTTLLVEGRVGVMVPASWRVQRITGGPGSARVQVVSTIDADVAIHLTQSSYDRGSTLPMAAEQLRSALSEEPGGVFVDFNPADRRAGRPAVTYLEIRGDRRVEWIVLVEDTVRIAIGCQSPVGREHLVRDICEQSIRSAHPIF